MDSLFHKPRPVKQTKRNSNLKTLSFTVDQRTEVGLNDFAWRSIKSGNVFKTEITSAYFQLLLTTINSSIRKISSNNFFTIQHNLIQIAYRTC